MQVILIVVSAVAIVAALLLVKYVRAHSSTNDQILLEIFLSKLLVIDKAAYNNYTVNIVHHCINRNIPDIVKYAYLCMHSDEPLKASFDWKQSPEGFEYWNAINNKLNN
jgi:hypothetical protein